jgi:hypothetical protein
MGLVHTAIRSRLGVEKVRKTTVVGMDIKRSHIESGWVLPREHRKFEMPTSNGPGNDTPDVSATELNISSLENVLDFEELAEELINDASTDIESDSDSDDEQPPLTIRLPLHAIHAALPPSTPLRPVPKTAIPLKLLFIFPTGQPSSSSTAGLDYFWQGGIKNLDKEMEAFEILCASQESPGEADANVPTAGSTS